MSTPLSEQCKRTAEAILILYLQQSQYDPDRETGQLPYNRRPVQGGMAPPPIPVDPVIDSWGPSNTAISSGIGLDNLLQFSPRPPDRFNLPRQNNIESFSHELQLPAMRQNSTEPNPLIRFWNEPGPWNPQRIGGDQSHTPTNARFPSFDDPIHRNPHALQYGYPSARSEVDSSFTGRPRLDSGYGGSRSLATTSAGSVDQFDQSRFCQSISGDVRDVHLYSGDRFQDTSTPNGPSPPTQYAPMDVRSDTVQQNAVTLELVCPYAGCGTISKNQSEQR